MRITEIAYNIAVPAPKLEIFKYILTGGRYGKLFVKNRVEAKKYWAEQDPRTISANCRCSTTPIKHSDSYKQFSVSKKKADAERARSRKEAVKRYADKWSKYHG